MIDVYIYIYIYVCVCILIRLDFVKYSLDIKTFWGKILSFNDVSSPIAVTALSNLHMDLDRLSTGPVGSNPAQGMDMLDCLVLSCVGRCLATG
jgi:hypothetical protein